MTTNKFKSQILLLASNIFLDSHWERTPKAITLPKKGKVKDKINCDYCHCIFPATQKGVGKLQAHLNERHNKGKR